MMGNKKVETICIEPGWNNSQEEINGYQYMPPGKKFYSYGQQNSCMNFYNMSETGEPVAEYKFSYQAINYSVSVATDEKVYSKVVDFDDKTVTAILYFSDHESKRVFKERVHNCLLKKNLLEIGQCFYIITKDIDNGFQIEIEAAPNTYDVEVADFYNALKGYHN